MVGGRPVGDTEPRVLYTQRRPVAERTPARGETSRMPSWGTSGSVGAVGSNPHGDPAQFSPKK